MCLIYIASPYTHEDPQVVERRFRAVCKYAAMLMADGCHVYSPIAHTHPIAMAGELPTDWGYWEKFDRTMLVRSDAVYVLQLPGWEQSRGVASEIEIAKEIQIDVTMIPEGEHFYAIS